MKQLTAEAFAQVRKALLEATVYIEVESSIEHSKDHQAAIAALDTAQPVQVNAMLVNVMLVEALGMWQTLANGGAETSTIVDGVKTQTLAQYTTYLDRLEAVKKSTEVALTAAKQAQPKKTLETMAQEAALEQAQPERAPLTQEQIEDVCVEVHLKRDFITNLEKFVAIARAIEQAHGIKQGGQHD